MHDPFVPFVNIRGRSPISLATTGQPRYKPAMGCRSIRQSRAARARALLGTYQYDGRHHRIVATVGSTTTHDYFNDNWQVVEQRVGSSTAASAQFIWSAAYIDALVQEKRDTDANGSLDRTMWATHDANFNITAAVQTDGIAGQRYLYDPYGLRSILSASWQPPFGTPTALLQHGHQGGRYDTENGLILFRHRYLNVSLQRWISRDPAGYVDGGSLYGYALGNPLSYNDPQGLDSIGVAGPKSGAHDAAWWANDHMIEATSVEDMLRQLEYLRSCGIVIDSVSVYDHGQPGLQNLGEDRLFVDDAQLLRRLGDLIEPNGELMLRGCNVGDGPIGRNYVQRLANATNRRVSAPIGKCVVLPVGGTVARWSVSRRPHERGLEPEGQYTPTPKEEKKAPLDEKKDNAKQ